MTGYGRRFGTFIGTVAVAAAATLSAPTPVAACVGGMEFDWAIAHARGWIATATVAEAEDVSGGSYWVALDNVEQVRGSPPALRQATVAMGAVCSQSPDAGERILVLEDVAIQPPYVTPIAYVISGSDAVPAADVVRVLRSMPSTDTAPAGTAASGRSLEPAFWLLAVGLGAVWLAMRRFARERRGRL